MEEATGLSGDLFFCRGAPDLKLLGDTVMSMVTCPSDDWVEYGV